ncbi:MAG: hypothetical protein ACYTFI_15600, partial [Planctomycetota bacterium]
MLIRELEKKFGAGSFRTGESAAVVFPAKHADVGDVEIWDDGEEAILSVGGISHGHFACYDDDLPQDQARREVIEEVVDFLEDLFSDRILL